MTYMVDFSNKLRPDQVKKLAEADTHNVVT